MSTDPKYLERFSIDATPEEAARIIINLDLADFPENYLDETVHVEGEIDA